MSYCSLGIFHIFFYFLIRAYLVVLQCCTLLAMGVARVARCLQCSTRLNVDVASVARCLQFSTRLPGDEASVARCLQWE